MSTGTDTPGRRARKKHATRLALKRAAVELVVARGFAQVTVEDIAEAADVSVRTFFNYFPSKEAAVVGDDPERRAELCQALLDQPRHLSPLAALRSVLLERLAELGGDPLLSPEEPGVWLQRLAALHAQPELRAAYAKHLAHLERALADALVVRLGGESDRLYAALVSAAVLAAVRVASVSWDGTGGATALLTRVGDAFDYLAAGLCPRPAHHAPVPPASAPSDETRVPGRTRRLSPPSDKEPRP